MATTKRKRKSPEGTEFAKHLGDMAPADFKKYYELRFTGKWEKIYKALGGKLPKKATPEPE